MTILEIWTLTWVHVVNEPYHTPSRAYDAAIDKLLQLHLIRAKPTNVTGYETTPLGAAYVERLKNLRIPESATVPVTPPVRGRALYVSRRLRTDWQMAVSPTAVQQVLWIVDMDKMIKGENDQRVHEEAMEAVFGSHGQG